MTLNSSKKLFSILSGSSKLGSVLHSNHQREKFALSSFYKRSLSEDRMAPKMKKPKEEMNVDSQESIKSLDDQKPIDINFGFCQVKPIDEQGFKQFLSDIKETKKLCGGIKDFKLNHKRIRQINNVTAEEKGNYKGVSFWMFRDQRVDDNWALIFAQKYALEHKCPLYVTFFLMSHYSVAGIRQYDFMLKGLQQVEKQCRNLGIQFHLELGYAKDHIVDYCKNHQIDFVIADFCPLRDPMSWVEEAGEKLGKSDIPLYQVDAHNIVPCWVASNKLEVGARTIRPKIHSHLPEFLTEMPAVETHPYQPKMAYRPVDWDAAWAHLKIVEKVPPVTWAKPGTLAGYRLLYEFITQRLKNYNDDRNIPTKHGLSCLSPYLHFGQSSIQRAILCVTVRELKVKNRESVDAFVEESVIRRELSDNYCFYQPEYDNINGAWDWARKSVREHEKDKREYIYTLEEFEFGKTHDKLWNAGQIQLNQEGKMHGFMRMYWAKKIFEWSTNVDEAIMIANYLNDKYSLDGRDPNGYVGIMWSIVGVHDRGWTERPIFGKIRWMSYNGCTKKFDIDRYVRYYH